MKKLLVVILILISSCKEDTPSEAINKLPKPVVVISTTKANDGTNWNQCGFAVKDGKGDLHTFYSDAFCTLEIGDTLRK